MSDAYQTVFDSTNSQLTKSAIKDAEVDDHVMRRSVTVNRDEVLSLARGTLRVATREFVVIKEEHYYCTCGAEFEHPEGAESHLRDVSEA